MAITHLHYEATQCGTRQDLGVRLQQLLAHKPIPQIVTDHSVWVYHAQYHLMKDIVNLYCFINDEIKLLHL